MTSENQLIEEKALDTSGDPCIIHYSKGRLLGKGGFAKVFEFTCVETKHITAGKVFEKTSLTKARARQKLMSEIKIQRSLKHPNIVKFEHYFEDDNNVYILLELCTNQSLNDLIRRRKRLLEIEVQCYLFQVLSALKYMHSHCVIHRDIKLGNIFLSDKMELKMGDFGLAAKLEYEGERKRTICGTPNYIAPEVLEGKSGHSYEVDIWSFGVLMFTMLVGKPPFETNDVKATYKKIKMSAYSFPENNNLSDEAKDIISRILVKDPQERPMIDEIMNHPFFTKNNVPKLLPSSTLAIPPSSAYIKQFSKSEASRPNSRCQQEISEKVPRSASQQPQNEEQKDLGRITPRETQKTRERSDSAGSGSGSRIKKAAITSNYSVTPNGPLVWVMKWVDYSNKYGLGYVLSNGAPGVFFNDSTKILGGYKTDDFCYCTKPLGKQEEDDVKEYNFSAFPNELQKKVTLLQHFRKNLVVTEVVSQGESERVSIKKWMATSHAIIFRLSNKVVQVYFQDKTELMLCSSTRLVIYVDKKASVSVYALASAMESNNKEMTKRLKYTKEILTNMIQPLTDTKRGSLRAQNN